MVSATLPAAAAASLALLGSYWMVSYYSHKTDAATGQRTSLTVDGHRVVIYKPLQKEATDQMPRKMPAVVVLHGSESTPENMFKTGFEPLADKHGFIVVYPSTNPPKADDWGYRKTLPFFSELSSRLTKDDIGVDETQLFICGHSSGGTMTLFLQNEMDAFQAAGAVEAAVGSLDQWNMTRSGKRTMVIWNHADPVLEEYAPPGGEPAYYNLTVKTLRRNGSQQPSSSKALPTSKVAPYAELLAFPQDSSPELAMLSWRSQPGTHKWASSSWTQSVDAAEALTQFFFRNSSNSKISADVVV